jgi:very-short-patch-repair endonuclease
MYYSEINTMAYDYNTADPFYYGMLKEYASENRKFQTDAERMLWRYLSTNKLGIHFSRQHIIGCYIADFVCLRKKLVIEVDGGYHSKSEQAIKDYYRTEDLERMGFKVIRFRNEDIETNISLVLDQIFNKLSEPS